MKRNVFVTSVIRNEPVILMLKQYVFVPKQPRMSAGKIASQVAHATFMALEQEPSMIKRKWKKSGMCVIVLEAKSNNHLMEIDRYLEQWKVTHYLYIDEGYTEVPPMTATALATGIVKDRKQWMFEKFRMYGQKRLVLF